MYKKLFTLLFLIFAVQMNALSEVSQQQQYSIKTKLNQLYKQYKNVHEGKNADYIPELAKVNSNYFGIVVMTVDGRIETVGDVDVPFAIESISKIFTYGLALMDNNEALIVKKAGLNATGKPFNSITAIEEMPEHKQNPLVNAGAIEMTSFIKGNNSEEKWQRVFNFMQALGDNKLFLSDLVYKSESTTNLRNRAIANLMKSYDLINGDPMDALDRYTKACSVMVSAKQLALMGATLANNGVNPISKKQVIPTQYARDIFSEMVVNGLYENSGAWWWTVGLPAKSGVGGGILAIVPHNMAIVVFSPPLDVSGNSVRGQAVIKALSQDWDLHLLN